MNVPVRPTPALWQDMGNNKNMDIKTTYKKTVHRKKGTQGMEPTCSELAWDSGHRTHWTGPVSGSVPTPEFLEFRDPAIP